MSELRRLGRREAYRLGTLRTQGVGQPTPPRQFRPSFLPRHRGPVAAWVTGFLAGAAAIAAAAVAGLWFVPFFVGAAAGFCGWLGRWRLPVTLAAAAAMALVGWGVPLVLASRHGHLARLAGHVTTAMPGLSAHTDRGMAAAALVAAAAALAGASLSLALARGVAHWLWH